MRTDEHRPLAVASKRALGRPLEVISMRMNALATALGLIAMSQTGFAADIYRYVVENHPMTEATCDAEVQALADRFHAQTGADIFGTECRQGRDSRDLIVSYIAEDNLPVYSTFGSLSIVGRTGYEERATCAYELTREVQAYVEQVGSQPMVAYCYPEERTFSSEYFVRVEGVALTGQKPFAFQGMLTQVPMGSVETIETALENNRSRGGLVISRASFVQDRLGDVTLALRYYSSEEKNFRLRQIMPVSTGEECGRVLPGFFTGLGNGSGAAVTAFCAQWAPEFSLIALVDETTQTLRSERVGQSYASLGACEMKRQDVEATYRTRLGRNVVSTTCTKTIAGADMYVVSLRTVTP